MSEYSDSLRKTPVAAAPPKPVAAAPNVRENRTSTPSVAAPASAPVAAPQAAPVAPPAALRAQATDVPRFATAPVDANSANAREGRTQNFISGGTGVTPGPSIASRVGNFFADYGKAAMSPLTEMAVMPAAQGITQGYANQKLTASGVEVSRSPQVTISAEAKNKLNPFVDPVTGKVDRGLQAKNAAFMVGGAAAGAAVGKYVLPKATQAISNKVSRIADIPDPSAKFQGGTSVLPVSTKPLNQSASAATKTKATLAAGLSAATSSPANAGARAVIQDVSVVPRSAIGRITREYGSGPGMNLSTQQFVSSRANLAASNAARAAVARASIAKANRATARDAASRLTGSAVGASIAGYSSSAIPDSSIAIINNNVANAVTKTSMQGTADRIGQTRAEDISPVINNVTNPFNNSSISTTPAPVVRDPNPPEGPITTKVYPPIVGDFKGGVGQQDVSLKKVF